MLAEAMQPMNMPIKQKKAIEYMYARTPDFYSVILVCMLYYFFTLAIKLFFA